MFSRTVVRAAIIAVVLQVVYIFAYAGAPKIEMVQVKGGCYQMGDTFGDGVDEWEKPVHEVCVDDFTIGKYDVTQGQWEAVMGNNPSFFKSCGDNCPVEQVSWNDAQDFIHKLNEMTGEKYRLPTDAEWEYAARSGEGMGNMPVRAITLNLMIMPGSRTMRARRPILWAGRSRTL